ncbi:ERF family protein [Desulfovibrio falkowii]|uniref:ERF family protein n=1 Tax=Desulfovibrio sp. WGS1351 TaxID=3366814 RepID=UPI00372CF5DB
MEHSTYCSAEITDLARAMLKVQADLQPALKDRENTFSHSRYATLNSVMEACRYALISNGIWLAQYPVPVEAGHMGLVTKLTHAESGQWQSSLMVMPLPKADPQGYGSAMTYSRRYALSALIGIVTEEDDDGVGAGTDTGQRPRRKRQAQPKEDIPAMGAEAATGTDPQIHSILATMPRLDGINYSLTTTQDGKTCIVASGNTANKKQILSQAGFKYSEHRRIWWRYADAA